jgi:hypothetical protein
MTRVASDPNSESNVLARYVRNGGGLATIVGINNSKNEAAFPNAVLSSSLLLGSPPDNTAIQYSVSPASDMSVLADVSTISGSWDGSNNEKHDGFRKHDPAASITKNLDTLRVTHGFAVRPATTGDNPVLFAFARGYDPDTNSKYTDYTMGVAGKYGSGRVVVWGDEWVTYDTVWTNEDRGKTYTADVYWDNVIKWLGKCGE